MNGRNLNEKVDLDFDLEEFDHIYDQDMKDYFYRSSFFAFFKWFFVMVAALVGIRHSRKTDVKEGWRFNYRLVRKARWLILIASVFGLTELYFNQ